MPTAEEQGATASAGSAERPRDSEGESEEQPYQYRQVEDPEVPPDEAGCFEAPECLMLGQRRPKSKVHHDGRYDVCELFSQARVAAEASTMGLRGGWSLDINHVDTITITGETWDLCTERDQRRVWKLLGRDKPLVAGLSPECTLFSQLQNLRKSEIDPEIMAKLIECMKFSVKVAKYKMRRGRFFYFEHPLSAKSWYLDELWELSQHGDVEAEVVHMCCVALTAEDSAGTGLEKKPTKVLTSLPSIASAIDRQCEGGHRHVRLTSGRAQAAAEYTQEFCNAIVTGVDIYNQHLGEALTGHNFLVEEGELMNRGSDMCDPSEELPFTFNDWGYCVDDVKGGLLPMDLVREARRSETEGFAQRRVYGIRPRWECEQEGGKVVGVRWVMQHRVFI